MKGQGCNLTLKIDRRRLSRLFVELLFARWVDQKMVAKGTLCEAQGLVAGNGFGSRKTVNTFARGVPAKAVDAWRPFVQLPRLSFPFPFAWFQASRSGRIPGWVSAGSC
jgi:hypothetical protein